MSTLYQPQYHFYPLRDFMNDPNGLIYYEGEYHLFYQHLLPRHWGHAVSTDLIHWRILPIALTPDHLGDIWSGSAVLDRDNNSGFFTGADEGGLVAIFTHQNGQVSPPLGPQVQSLAYSQDRGRSWTKYEQNPVIENTGTRDFRDPSVFWHEQTQAWIMVVTFQCDRVQIYRSSDLKQWELASEFGVGQGFQKGGWECPSLFTLPVDDDPDHLVWVLHVSLIIDQDPTLTLPRMQYFLGHFDGYTFTNANSSDRVLWSDYGRDHYAAIPWNNIPDEDGRRIWLGWCSNWSYAGKLPTGDWQGMMTIPRTLHLKTLPEGVALVQRPVVELTQLRESETPYTLAARSLADEEFVLPIQSGICEIIATFERGSASDFGLQVRKGPDQQTTVGYDTASASVFVDRTHSGENSFSNYFAARHDAPLTLHDDVLKLHIFVDASSIEVFANDGERVITDLIFPDPDSQQIAVYARNGDVTVRSLEVYSLRAAPIVD